ncbi:MAG: hypothetical protein AABX38_08330 [Candidatus Micrarchaeota archaeon]
MEMQQTIPVLNISKDNAILLHNNVVKAYSKFSLLNQTAIYKESFLRIKSVSKDILGIKVKLGKIVSINKNTYEGNEVHTLIEVEGGNKIVLVTFDAKVKRFHSSNNYFEYKIKSYYDYMVDEQDKMAILAGVNLVN